MLGVLRTPWNGPLRRGQTGEKLPRTGCLNIQYIQHGKKYKQITKITLTQQTQFITYASHTVKTQNTAVIGKASRWHCIYVLNICHCPSSIFFYHLSSVHVLNVCMYANKLKAINNSITTMIFQLCLNGDNYTGFKCCNISWVFSCTKSSDCQVRVGGAP